MAVSFNYIPSNTRVPLFYAEMDNSMANTATGEKKALLIGLMSSSGEATANSPITVSSVSKAKTLFGAGSELALMVEAYRNQDPTGILYCVPLILSDESNADNPGVAATGTVTIAGTATESGTVALYIGSKKVPVTVASGASATAVGTSMVAKINSISDLPVTAVLETTDGIVVKLTAKSIGAFANDIPVQTNLKGITGGESNVAGISVTASAMAGGVGTVDVEAAFKAVGDEAFNFICVPDCDSTILDLLQTEMNDASGRWSYAKMLYGHVFTAKRGDESALVTFGTSRNDQHVSVFGLEPKLPEPAFIVAAAVTGREAGYITIDPARPTQTGPLVGLYYSKLEDRFNLAARNTLLHSGIATLYVSGGYLRIERAVTTYQVNTFGDEDNSYLDSETLFTLAEITTRLKTAITSKYPRHKLASDGTRYGAGQAIVTPSVIRSELIAQYAAMENLGLVENADLFAKYLIVERNADDPNRVDVLLPPDLVNQLRIFALQNQFRLQYGAND